MTTESDAAWVRDQFGASVIGGADPWSAGEVSYEYLPDEAGHLVRPIDAATAGRIAELLATWQPRPRATTTASSSLAPPSPEFVRDEFSVKSSRPAT
jgi:hypothetical protein